MESRIFNTWGYLTLPVILATREILEARCLVGQNVGVGDVREESLFRETELQPAVRPDRHVVQIL